MSTIFIITIDAGTTNSRIRLIDNTQKKIIAIRKSKVGVSNTAVDGNNQALKNTITDAINAIIDEKNIECSEIKYIVASGMITSNLGLYEVPHIQAPANIQDIADAVQVVQITGFPDIPCYFITGIRNKMSDDEHIYSADVMRGEETETIGLINNLNLEGNGMLVLPGSHNKFIFMENKKIMHSVTTMSGELLSAVSGNTILTSSLDQSLISEVESDFISRGYADSLKYGLTRTLFQIRLLDILKKSTRNNRANYMTGSVIAADLQAVNEETLKKLDWILLAGSEPLKEAFTVIFKQENYGPEIIVATEKDVEYSTVLGAITIVEEYLRKK